MCNIKQYYLITALPISIITLFIPCIIERRSKIKNKISNYLKSRIVIKNELIEYNLPIDFTMEMDNKEKYIAYKWK